MLPRVDIVYATRGGYFIHLQGPCNRADIVYTTGVYILHAATGRYCIYYQECTFYMLPGCLLLQYQGCCNVYTQLGVHIVMVDHPIDLEYLLVDGLGLS